MPLAVNEKSVFANRVRGCGPAGGFFVFLGSYGSNVTQIIDLYKTISISTFGIGNGGNKEK